jgi:hypothetical protein
MSDNIHWKKISMCSVCYESNSDSYHSSNCCGLEWCCSCDAQLSALCPICEREELNQIGGCCYNCGIGLNLMSMKICRWCDETYCVECLYLNESVCNYNHICKKRDCKISGYLDYINDSLENNPERCRCWYEYEENGEDLINKVLEETLSDIISQIEI